MEKSRNCVYVYNLDLSISDATFISYFRNYCSGVLFEPKGQGPRIIRDELGRSKQYGFVNFIDSLSAERVVSKRYHMIDGKRAICKLASESRRRNQIKTRNLCTRESEPKHLKQLYVRNFTINTTEQQLKTYFLKFTSDVIRATIIYDKNNKKSAGYGYVEFRSSSSVDLIQSKRPHKINNQDIQTSRCYPKNVPVHLKRPSTVLYVLMDFNEHVDKDEIIRYFEDYGDITSTSHHRKRLEGIEYMEIHFNDYDDVDLICLKGEKHTIAGYYTVTVTKFLEDDNIRTETQHTLKPTIGDLESNTVNSRPLKNSSQLIQPSAPPLFPDPQPPIFQQFAHNPYFLNNQPVQGPSFESQTRNSQQKPLLSTPRSSLPPGSEVEDDVCQCCIIL